MKELKKEELLKVNGGVDPVDIFIGWAAGKAIDYCIETCDGFEESNIDGVPDVDSASL